MLTSIAVGISTQQKKKYKNEAMKGYGLGYSCMSFCFLWDWSVSTWKMREFTMTGGLSVSTEPRFVSSTIDRAEESLWSSRCSSNFRKKQGFGGSSRLNTMWIHNSTYSPWHLDSKNQRETRTRQVTQGCANRRRQQTETIHQGEREREREKKAKERLTSDSSTKTADSSTNASTTKVRQPRFDN